ncbi:homoserine dehydrogenase [bacterium]|nr:homoserine dehydrogenase [bacterium]
MVKPLTVGLIGFGNIGAGVVRSLDANRAVIAARLPRPIVIKTIADKDTTTKRDAPYNPDQLTSDLGRIYNDPEIDVVIELVGGEEPARTFVARALEAGKHVVTANKALLAVHGPELMALAKKNNVGLLYEAAVGGGIPIIRTLEQGLPANVFSSIMGIFNGTCNYILTRMGEAGLSFDAALAEAQKLGYAEPDPTYDIEGYDTAHKTAILSSLAFGMDIRFKDVYVEGITRIESIDIQYARELGYAIKLLGIAKRPENNGGVEVRVHPTLVPMDSPLGQVNGVFNGVRVDGWPIGRTFYYGRGAGADATSSAVISDLMALAADENGFNPWRDSRLQVPVGQRTIKPMTELRTHYYIRFSVADRPGAMATIGRALADVQVSIESMIQHRITAGADQPATVSIVTHDACEAAVQSAIARVEADPISSGRAFVLRVEE